MTHKVFMACASMMGLLGFAVEAMTLQEELFQGASTGSLELLESALARGALIEEKDVDGLTALHVAARGGSTECLRILLEKGAQIEAQDMLTKTALHWASGFGHVECLEVLLQNKAQIESKDSGGKTALHWAVFGNFRECVQELLGKGAQIKAKDDTGKTALQWAASMGHRECLRALLLAEAHIVVSGTSCRVIAPSEAQVQLSRRSLKLALLSLRYAGATSDEDKSKNRAGDLIVSNDYIRSWFLLSHSGLREDVFVVLMNLLAKSKKVEYALFRLAKEKLGDYLVMKLRDTLGKINAIQPLESVVADLSATERAEIRNLCDPELVEKNFGDLLRNSVKARFNELLMVTGALSQSTSSSQSSSSVKEQSTLIGS